MRKTFFALILIALAACAPQPETVEKPSPPPQADTASTPTSLPLEPGELLPQTLHYLSQGQVFRMERDGMTVTQLTSEPASVDSYDISPLDGSIVYVVENLILLIDADGTNRRVLVDGGPRDMNNPQFFMDPLSDPVFSPDGTTIAYAQFHNGLMLYDLDSGVSSLAIADQFGEPMPGGARFPIETYAPVSFSPDGKKLLVSLGHWESLPTHAVYHLDTNVLVRYTDVQNYIYCCSFYGGPVWAPDSSSFYGVASVHDCGYKYGELWKIDAVNGEISRLFNSSCAGTETTLLPVEPFAAPDSKLYYFLGEYQPELGYWEARTLNMVRAGPDGVTGRTFLREDNFLLLEEALWAPDGSLVVVSMAPARNWNQAGGVLELYYTDGRKSMVWLAPNGHRLKWGP